MKLGVYNAILHDRSLPEALKVIADLGLSAIEINTGGFLPATHVPTMDDILVSDAARDDFLAIFEGTGVSIGGLNCNGNPLHPNAVIGDKHGEDVRRSVRLANRLGQHRVVTMSGLPHAQSFKITCRTPLVDEISIGSGGSRKKAEQSAAEQMLALLKREKI